MCKREFMDKLRSFDEVKSINVLVNKEENWTEITINYKGIKCFIDSANEMAIDNKLRKIKNWLKGTCYQDVEIKIEDYII